MQLQSLQRPILIFLDPRENERLNYLHNTNQMTGKVEGTHCSRCIGLHNQDPCTAIGTTSTAFLSNRAQDFCASRGSTRL